VALARVEYPQFPGNSAEAAATHERESLIAARVATRVKEAQVNFVDARGEV
jgi:hypothetical protein